MDPWDLLQIPVNSEKEVINKAFRNLALTVHPDKRTFPPNVDPKQKEDMIKGFDNYYIRLVNAHIIMEFGVSSYYQNGRNWEATIAFISKYIPFLKIFLWY